jgi:hypothetical protein
MKYKKQQRLRIIHSLEEIPVFASEEEERDWWGLHDLSPELYDRLERLPSPSGTLRFILRERQPAKTTSRGRKP